MTNLAPQQWLQLKPSTREALVKIFRIPRSTYVHVVNDGGRHRIESDGYTYDDLKAISLDEMRRLTNDPSDDFFKQFELVIKMVEDDGSKAAEYPQPEGNATNESLTSAPEAAGIDTGAVKGADAQAPVNEEKVLPVPGGEQQVNPGRAELLPNSDGNDRTGVAAEKKEVSPQQPKAGKDGGLKPRGLQKNQVGAGPV